jgi:hypothetical protein
MRQLSFIGNFRQCFLVAIFLFLTLKSFAATITYQVTAASGNCEAITIDVVGEIATGDFLQVSKLVAAFKRYSLEKKCEISRFNQTLRLNSNGGDVREAISIGRNLRENNFQTIVALNHSCLSSCVLAFIGGTNRISIGKIGIHRPYFSDLQGNPTAKEIREMRDKNNQNTKKYLDDMDVAVSLFDAMQAIPPESMKILSESELSSYRIIGEDASSNEQRINELAKNFGLTMSEYRKRDGIVTSTCGTFGNNLQWYDCKDSVMYGISIPTLISRRELVKTTCLKLQSDSEKISCFDRIMKYGK